jgi:ferric-dicitrate binding protein FerR (iron transport regulator)
MNRDDRSDEPEGETVARLLARAERRADPPATAREAVYRATLDAWQDSTRSRRRVRFVAMALAASVAVMAVAVVSQRVGGLREPSPIAALLGDGASSPLRVGEVLDVTLRSGQVVRTLSGEQLRLAHGTRVEFESTRRLRLHAGRVYFQSAASEPRETFQIRTNLALISDVGTRYSVEESLQRLTVRVRDGAVQVETPTARSGSEAGTETQFDAGGREVARRAIASHGADWQWADALTPPLQVDGRSLADVLQEIAFESGRRLEFADPGVLAHCQQIKLRGPVLDLSTGDRLFAVLATTRLEALENGDLILIRRRAQFE